MSASQTNIEKQKERHRGPLTVIAISLICVLVLLGGFLGWTSYQAGEPTAASPAEVLSD